MSTRISQWMCAIKRYFRRRGDRALSASVVSEASPQKKNALYDEKAIANNKYYEQWAKREAWQVKHEALFLLLSVHPENYRTALSDEEFKARYQDLWTHAKHSISQGLLPILNRDCPEDEWTATPVEIYKWAIISRVEMPSELVALMQFLMTSIASPKSPNMPTDQTRVLGAALAVVAAYPKQCKVPTPDISRIGALIERHKMLEGGRSLTASERETIMHWLSACKK